jgi:xylan 1,4-beta-xylosidase
MTRHPRLAFAGDYPDPSILRHDGWWYATHSSFRHSPGLQIWRSRDLVSWEHVAYALTCGGLDVWAPELVFHAGTFHIYFFASGRNRVVSAPAITGPWSEPVILEVGWIDPGHVVDASGQRWLHVSDGQIAPLSADGLTITGPHQRAYEPWPIPADWVIEGVCLEGPKLWWQDGWCHLLAAQGGTAGPATSHMVLHARAKDPRGPWTWNPHGPVLRTRHRDEAWWSVGHGSLVTASDGAWLMVHGYRRDFITLGRQTLLVPVAWGDDGWLQPITEPVDAIEPEPLTIRDDFRAATLAPHWRMWDRLDATRVASGDGLRLGAAGTSLRDSAPLTVIPGHHDYTIEAELERPAPGLTAGLCLFYNAECFLAFTCDERHVMLTDRAWTQDLPELPAGARRVRLRLRNDHHAVTVAWAADDGPWQVLPVARETSGWQHNVFGGFLSLRAGLCACGAGTARFSRFGYSGG